MTEQAHPQTDAALNSGNLLYWVDLLRQAGLRDAAAGFVASVVLIANIISFGALMFHGELSAGIPIAIWSMLVGGCIGGFVISLATSLPPIATGIDSPTGAVLVLLSASVSNVVIPAGGTPADAIQTTMVLFTAATLLSGLTLYLFGALRWGEYFRFVPYSVVAGFLAATGLFLFLGGARIAIGRSLTANPFTQWTLIDAAKIGAGVAALLILLAVRRWIKSGLALPVALLAMWLCSAAALHVLGASEAHHGWYLPALGSLAAWSPFTEWHSTHVTRSEVLAALPELIAVVLVAVVSLVTKVASLELARQVPADLNQEFRCHGIGNMIAAPFGGLASSLQTGTSRLLDHAGSMTRASGAVAAAVLGLVAVTNFNLAGIVPLPVIVGLVFYLGYTFIVDTLWRPFEQRAWLDLSLALIIMSVCVLYGYLVGVLAGIVCACVLFAVSYSRRGVVRRHATRATFASYVTRPPELSKYLQEAGAKIQIYWLSGHIFFGSAESLFERVRGDIAKLPPGEPKYLVLDFEMVSGADTSAILSITKIRDFCLKHKIVFVCASATPSIEAALQRSGCFKHPKGAFADLNVAVAWCEDQLLASADVSPSAGEEFESWLKQQLGSQVSLPDLFAYLEIKSIEGSEVIYRQGDPADTMDIVAEGALVVDVANEHGETVRVRRIDTHSVVGEMGFFRRAARSATVSSDGPAKLFTLSRANFDRMRQERPDLAYAYDDFIVSTMADRVDIANRSLTALRR
ncbi:SLC26A/SulP transporter family protein [Rhodoplanes sp. Z2-YC6860]|uniref:SLC26A/SulP transporter family protein n=1 Tax=Rhodoplanes sp. Z2-YC6860 TaxID=674703 RepID=UPI00078C77DF|nr:SulP family inorganic anion transporter [Rhodoplanes sp. Z2-YC6860]AMN42849.1 cyclic nucleotide-binding protein [Rhodoplanes sp. Z2-YC6860]